MRKQLSLLPSRNLVVDYFRWRMEDASRNCLNGHCYWTLRSEGASAAEASRQLKGLSNPQKHDFMFVRGINFNDLPAWQKRGCGVYWSGISKNGLNPLTGEVVITSRRCLLSDMELPLGEQYDQLLYSILEDGLVKATQEK